MVPGTSASIMFFIILICATFTIVAPPGFGLVCTLITTAVFALSSFYLKDLTVFLGDLIMLTAVVPAAIAFNWFSNVYKHQSVLNEVKLEEERDKFRQASTIDELTGLRNRRDFMLAFERFLNNGRSTDAGRFVCLALLDIDYFKNYNDHYGHPAGDECLRQMGRALRDLRDSAGVYTARVGGEEFAVLWLEQKYDGAQNIVKEILRHIKKLNIPHEKSLVAEHITVSIGVYASPCDASSDIDSIYGMADKALYDAKAKGRNCGVIIADSRECHIIE